MQTGGRTRFYRVWDSRGGDKIPTSRAPGGAFPYLCMNKMYMRSFPWERKSERRKKKCVRVLTQCPPMAYIECVMGVVKAGHGTLMMFNLTSNALS